MLIDVCVAVLHQTFPERAAFRTVRPFVELSVVVQKVFGATVGNSLSNATSRILGQPLDKVLCSLPPYAQTVGMYASNVMPLLRVW
jgi:hypothetical protein